MGSRFLVAGEMSVSQVIVVVMTIMLGAFSITNISPNIQAFTSAVSAAGKISNTIDRPSPLDPSAQTGQTLDQVEGILEMRHIKLFIHPGQRWL
jgi:ATP-binding cassette subfamily B (MDR/TAP) protein 1